MLNLKPTALLLITAFLFLLGWGIWSTRNIDSETGRPVHVNVTRYEDGSDSTGYCEPGALCDDSKP